MTAFDVTGMTGDPAVNQQIIKMIEAANEPHRKDREDALNHPWHLPECAITFAIGKLTRIIKDPDWPSGVYILRKGIERNKAAEELREAAHYLLRAAALLEPISPRKIPSASGFVDPNDVGKPGV
jgi:hypothetical protein